jgi:hypothetical protein
MLNVSLSTIFIQFSYKLHSIQALFLLIMSQVRLFGSSLVGRVYIPSSLPLQASKDDSIKAFLTSLEVEFCLMLKGTHNRGIFNQAKKATYRCWLENLGGLVEGNTLDKLNKDCNNQQSALAKF